MHLLCKPSIRQHVTTHIRTLKRPTGPAGLSMQALAVLAVLAVLAASASARNVGARNVEWKNGQHHHLRQKASNRLCPECQFLTPAFQLKPTLSYC
ncbi:hypothetical protein [Shewanella sp.]|uniref:hypothetical protein n=1 Tax=Shewanella sp. TaxID=50422 RepID=UPI003F304493